MDSLRLAKAGLFYWYYSPAMEIKYKIIMKEGFYISIMDEELLLQNYDLEKKIRKANKAAKDKIISLQKREKRKLGIKEKKLVKKSIVREEEF